MPFEAFRGRGLDLDFVGVDLVAPLRSRGGGDSLAIAAKEVVAGLKWNDGMTGLTTEWTVPVDGPSTLVVDDLDGDGLEEVLSGGDFEQSLVVRWSGSGTTSRLPLPCIPMGLAVGRLFGQEKAAVVGCYNQPALLVRGLAEGQFREETIRGTGYEVLIGQLDGRFGDDVLLIDEREGEIVFEFFPGEEGGIASEPMTIPAWVGFRPFGVAAYDLDEDGIDEVILGGHGDPGTISVAKLAGAEPTVLANILVPRSAIRLQGVDLPGTPGRELLVASNANANVSVVRSPLSPRPEVLHYRLGSWAANVTAFHDADGKLRLAAVDGLWYRQVTISDPMDEPIPTRVIVPLGKTPSRSTRVSNDGLLVTDLGGQQAVVVDLRLDHFGEARYLATDRGPSDGAAVDCMGDDRLELLVSHKYSETILVFAAGEEGSWSLVGTHTAGAFFRMDEADLDGDGRQELVALSADDGSIQVFSLDDQCRPGLVQMVRPGELGSDFVVTDFDGDGDVDVLVSDLSEPKITLLRNNAGILEGETIATAAPAWSLAVGDVDGDGMKDLMVADPKGKALELLLGGPGGRPRARVMRVIRNEAELVTAGDLDGDGEDEILVLARAGGVELFDGLSGGYAELGTLDQPWEYSWVALQDLDHDGTLDLIVSDVQSMGVAFERIRCAP